MVFKKKNSNNWYYKFVFRGDLVKQSTKQANKRVAEQMEAAHKTNLAKGQVGIVGPTRVPTVAGFASRFLGYVETANADKPKTVAFYKDRIRPLLESKLADLPLDSITSEHTSAFARVQRARGYEVSTVNRSLAVLRRMTLLLEEWEGVPVRKVKLLPGENVRDRVLTSEEEIAYLAAASPLLCSVATLMLDCGFRPEEVHRLGWSQYAEGHVWILWGKGGGSRRRVEVPERSRALLDSLPRESKYVFPAPTKTGHIDQSSYKDHHETAVTDSGVQRFVPYSLRHTAITRMAVLGLDGPALMYWAGHKSLATTMKYIHLAGEEIQARVRAARAKSGPSTGPTQSA